MKKLLINYTGKKGGGAEYAFEMTKALVNFDLEIYVIISKKVSNLLNWKKLNVKRIIEIETYNNVFGLFFQWLKLKFFINFSKAFKIPKDIDFIYVPMEQPLTKTINDHFKNSKVLLTIHDVEPHSGDNLIYSFFNYFLNYNTRSSSFRIVLLSDIFKNKFSQKYNFDEKHILVLKHGLFNKYFNISPVDIELNFIAETNYLFFGRISDYKGIDILLKAFNHYQLVNPKISLTIAGFGDLNKFVSLINNSKNLNILNRWITDEEIVSLFKISNTVLITPYKDASQSGVITLANLFKIPVISSNVGGLVEQVEHSFTGLLFDSEDILKLVKRMDEIRDKELVKFLVENAYNVIQGAWDESAKILFDTMNSNND